MRTSATSPFRAGWAEALIAAALERVGWRILDRNRRHIGYELDIVAQRGSTLVVVEVKTRRRLPANVAEAAELLPPRKRAALARGLVDFATRHPSSARVWRIDLAIVVPSRPPLVRYVPNAVDANAP
jgi:putative endonuclease